MLTAASIVNEPDRVWVEHNGASYSAMVIGFDRTSNLALLKLRQLPEKFSFLLLRDSAELPPIGTMVISLSAPLEFPVSPRLGLISGIEGSVGSTFFPCNHMRTTIPSGPGDGGAAYLDLKGRLVGVQVGSVPEVGSTYVIPARAAMRIRDDLLFNGEVTFGWVGFEVRQPESGGSDSNLELSIILPDTPAAEAGLLPGDVLQKVGGYRIRTLDDLRNAIFYTRVGEYVTISVLRNGETQEFNLRLVERPANEPLNVATPVQAPPASVDTSSPEGASDGSSGS